MLLEVLNIAFRVMVNCGVFGYLVLTPLKSRYRYDSRTTVALTALLSVITTIIVILFLTTGLFFTRYYLAGVVLWVLCAVIIFRLMICGSFFEILFIVFVTLNLYVNIAAVSKVMMNILDPIEHIEILNTVIGLGVLLLCFPLMWILVGRLYRQVIEDNIKFSFWKFIWVIPALFYMIFYTKIIPDYWGTRYQLGSRDMIFIILWFFTTYASFYVTLLMLIQTYKGTVAIQQAQVVGAQLKMQESQYEKLLDSIESSARLRHDWRHHLLSIGGFADSGNLEDLKKYLNELAPDSRYAEEAPLCSNHIADVILRHYAAIAKEREIAINISVEIPRMLTIADVDLCIILGNLTENAIEACTLQTAGTKTIDIRSEMKFDQLALLIQNTYDGEAALRQGPFYSVKHNGPGIGLSSVYKVVTANEGTLKIESDARYFKVYALFKVREPQTR